MSGWDKFVSVADAASGLVMIGESGLKVRPLAGFDSPNKYGSPRIASPGQTGARAFLFWDAAGRPAGGPISGMWAKARDGFLTQLGRPAYSDWRAASPSREPWWDGAVNAVKSDPRWAALIRTEAQTIAKSRPVTLDDEYAAIEKLNLQGEVGWEAFKQWLEAGSPKTSVTSTVWSNGWKLLLQKGQETYQRWRAEQDFVNTSGPKAYAAYKAALAAGIGPDPWWTAAIADFQTQIDAEAEALWNADKGPKPATWKDPANTDPAYIAQYTKYFNAAQDKFGTQIAVKAYQIWNYTDPATSRNYRANNKPPVTPVTTPILRLRLGSWNWTSTWTRTRQGPATLTYKTWDAAGRPARLTTKGGDDILLADKTTPLMKYLPRPGRNLITTYFRPSTYGTPWVKFGIPRHSLQHTPTDITVWTGAESAFKVHIGKKNFNNWTADTWAANGWPTNRPLGTEDPYFTQANQYYKNLIAVTAYGYFSDSGTLPGKVPSWAKSFLTGKKAYGYFSDPRTLPGRVPSWVKSFVAKRLPFPVTAEFWTANQGDYTAAAGTYDGAKVTYTGARDTFNTAQNDWTYSQPTLKAALTAVGRAWLTRSASTKQLKYWDQALTDLETEIVAERDRLYTADKGKLGGPDAYRPRAIENLIGDIASKAYENWLRTPSSSAKYAPEWTAARTAYDGAQTAWTGAQTAWTGAQTTWDGAQETWTAAQTTFGGGAYDAWQNAGTPDGWGNQAWVIAGRSGRFGGVVEHPLLQWTGQWFKDLGQQTWIRFTHRQGLFDGVGWRQHFGQMRQAAQFFGGLYAITNGVGFLGWGVANYFSHEVRKPGDPIKNPQDELDTLLKDPEGYMRQHYQVHVLGMTLDAGSGDLGFNEASGHLMVFTAPDGTNFYFHRIPEDLYNALKAQATVVSSSNPASAFEPWLLEPQANQYGDTKVFIQNGQLYVYQTVDLNSLGSFSFSPSDVNPLTGGLPASLKDQIGAQIGVQAYLDWLKAGMPQGTAGSSIWSTAQQAFISQRGTAAYTAWVNAGKPTAGDNVYWGQALASQSQIDAAAKALAGGGTPTQTQKNQAIALLAFQNWVIGGSDNQNTAGVAAWKTDLPTFQTQIGVPAFKAWVSANRPVQGSNASWSNAVTQWTKAGMPVMQLVELRLPWHDEAWNVDSTIFSGKSDGSGSRHRWTWGAGPIEGWRLHANFELTLNYRYNTATATTLRIGGPSPTQGWSWDVRQQDTTLWTRFTLGFGTWEVNGGATGTQVYDVTGRSMTGYTIMNGRIYLDTGNRNRIRLDATGQYARYRETAFVELGLGMDFAKFVTNTQTYNLNGYYEAQIYWPDFRSQLNWSSQGITNSRAFTPSPPDLGIDPALQFTISDPRVRVVRDLPDLSGEKR
jgi:hypothetical protein